MDKKKLFSVIFIIYLLSGCSSTDLSESPNWSSIESIKSKSQFDYDQFKKRLTVSGPSCYTEHCMQNLPGHRESENKNGISLVSIHQNGETEYRIFTSHYTGKYRIKYTYAHDSKGKKYDVLNIDTKVLACLPECYYREYFVIQLNEQEFKELAKTGISFVYYGYNIKNGVWNITPEYFQAMLSLTNDKIKSSI